MPWQKILPRFVTRHWNTWSKKLEKALVSFTPVYVSKDHSFFSPLIAVISVLTMILLFGVAVGSFFSLFSSLVLLYFILTKVFGFRMDLGEVFVVD